ncbi:fimbrillin family protein [Bacteroides heparinolyticus]|uniref:fimbrillin family protein n=1 Tax=Prevotella heparinolytica TaxID=28113 RepID=UPI0035A1BFF1
MNKKTFGYRSLLLCVAGFVAIGISSCSKEDTGGNSSTGNAVNFQVATEESVESRALAASGNIASDILEVEGDGEKELCIIEATTEYIGAPASRARIETSIKTNFTTLGYGGATNASITTTPDWFYNAVTTPAGKTTPAYNWNWANLRYGRFYAISPYVASSDTKLKLSPATHSGIPYVDFEVEQDVLAQRDLMTATTDVIHYATENVQPLIPLNFKHALTAVSFKVGSNLSYGKTINKIVIGNAYSKGQFQLANSAASRGTWSAHADRVNFTLDGLNISTAVAVGDTLAGKHTDNYTFYMLPQTLTGNDVKLQIYFSDNTNITATLSGEWKVGTKKTYMLSNKLSNWVYELSTESPAAIAYTATTTGDYSITSYRQEPGGTRQAVAWEVIGYDANEDNTFTMAEKPVWLTALSKTNGNGSVSSEKGTATLTVNETDYLLQRNNLLKNAAPKGTSSNYYNLSNSSGDREVQNTANSYLISAPGYYKLPLVYGNAIEITRHNMLSYKTRVKPEHANIALANFKSHAGEDIFSPYINTQNPTAPATQASVVWADESGLVTNLNVTGAATSTTDDDFLSFQVPETAIKQGNIVVAVKNANGVVMWSWHLWIAPADALSTITCINKQGATYKFPKEPLGWKFTTWKGSTYQSPRSVKVQVQQTVANNGVKKTAVITITQNNGFEIKGYPTLYQFGRKDAFPGTDNIPEGSINKNGGNNMSIVNGIQNPGTFYSWGTSWESNYGHCNYWAMENRKYGGSDESLSKTIYDPSPNNFQMPPSNAFTGFTKTGVLATQASDFNTVGSWMFGRFFNNKIDNPDAVIYFPVTGRRDKDNGNVVNASAGYYWSAIPYNHRDGSLFLVGGEVNPLASNLPSFGFAVRPIYFDFQQ